MSAGPDRLSPKCIIDAEEGLLEPLPPAPSFTSYKERNAPATGVVANLASAPGGDIKVSAPPISKTTALPSPRKPKPRKPKREVTRCILFSLWFNTYRQAPFALVVNIQSQTNFLTRKFFTFTFGLNMIGIFLASTNHFPYAVRHSGAMALGNFNCAILMRNEMFGRLLYLFVNTCFAKWPPLWFRMGCTSVLQHLGGIHSGCALSGVLWLLFKVIYNFLHADITHDSVLILGFLTNFLVTISALSAIPWVRNSHHNVFERHHRFVGWLGLVATWAFVIVSDTYNTTTRAWDLNGLNFIRHQELWFIMGMTIFVALPWVFVRKVPVDIELPSAKVAIIRFKRGMQQGLLGRIGRSSLLEYHAFGIVSLRESPTHRRFTDGVFAFALVQA
ncbi:hypothetical protein H0H81_010809 [Sphagnurus paluster]|uniref:Uncharacterized protein n=1 Tax=Sphagnurus paluster TaxID=117069 RepID=A0A9P7G2H2_9AGAR|nr:hypothetical protein H0H81_010809 [Sphagnurus paluster]